MLKRLITAIVLWIIAIVCILFLPKNWFSLFATLLVGLAAWEFSLLVGIQRVLYRTIYTIIAICAISIAFFIPMYYLFIVGLIIWVWALFALISYAKGFSALGFEYPLVKGIVGIIILIPFWAALNILRLTSLGPLLLLFAFIIVWSMDTGAFFIGRSLGKRKLIPRVSPNKTWEGLVGGFLVAIIVALIYALSRHLNGLSALMLIALTLITGFFAVIGDLFESMLKRQAGVKDSGTLFPGHGGILDRIDSAIAALPIFTLGILFFGA